MTKFNKIIYVKPNNRGFLILKCGLEIGGPRGATKTHMNLLINLHKKNCDLCNAKTDTNTNYCQIVRFPF